MAEIPFDQKLVDGIPSFCVVNGRILSTTNGVEKILGRKSSLDLPGHGTYRFLYVEGRSATMQHRFENVEHIIYLNPGKTVYVSRGDWSEVDRGSLANNPFSHFTLEDKYRLLLAFLRRHFQEMPIDYRPEIDPFAFSLDTKICYAILLCMEKNFIPAELRYNTLEQRVFSRIKSFQAADPVQEPAD